MNEVFNYIAACNQQGALELCNAYGYDPQTVEELVMCLQQIASNSQADLKNVMDLHPDKEILVELFASGKYQGNMDGYEGRDGGHCRKCDQLSQMLVSKGADGSTSMMSGHMLPVTLQTNNILTVGIITLVVVAFIIYKK